MVGYFESKIIVNRKAYSEVKKHLLNQDIQTTHTIAFYFCLIALLGGIIGGIIFQPLFGISFTGLLLLIAQRLRYSLDVSLQFIKQKCKNLKCIK